jgi:hypothetical protein
LKKNAYRAENIMDPEHTVSATHGAITRTNRAICGFVAVSFFSSSPGMLTTDVVRATEQFGTTGLGDKD